MAELSDVIVFRRGTPADARAAADLWLRARKAAASAIPPLSTTTKTSASGLPHTWSLRPSSGAPSTERAGRWAFSFSKGNGSISSTRRTSSACGAVQASRADHTGGAGAAVLSSLRQ
jgi:hypothetical protein